MRPACAKPSNCPRSDGDVPELCQELEDDGHIHEDFPVGAVIGSLIGLSVIVSLVMAFRRLCRQRQKVEVQVPPMQPMPAHAQMQAQPAHVMQGVQVQAQMQPLGVLQGASLALWHSIAPHGLPRVCGRVWLCLCLSLCVCGRGVDCRR